MLIEMGVLCGSKIHYSSGIILRINRKSQVEEFNDLRVPC
jgi:hypothetical protein